MSTYRPAIGHIKIVVCGRAAIGAVATVRLSLSSFHPLPIDVAQVSSHRPTDHRTETVPWAFVVSSQPSTGVVCSP